MVKQKIGYCQSSKTKGLSRLRFESFYVYVCSPGLDKQNMDICKFVNRVSQFFGNGRDEMGTYIYWSTNPGDTGSDQSKGASIDMTWRQCYIHPDLHLMTDQVQSSH